MRVLVCGSRSWRDLATIKARLSVLPAGSVIVHGGAPGADTLAGQAAALLGHTPSVFHAEWDRYGKSAGWRRNLAMLDTAPELVIGFWDGASRGTKHTLTEARRRGIATEVITSATADPVGPQEDPRAGLVKPR